MAEANFTIGFDDETKELIKALVKAVDRIAPQKDIDKSFGDGSKRLVENPYPTHYVPYWEWAGHTTNGTGGIVAKDGYIDEGDV